MNKRFASIIVAILVLIIIGIIGLFMARSRSTNEADTPSTGTMGTTSATSVKPNILVSQPQPGQRVGTPVSISGQAREFEGTVNYRLRGSDGKIIAQGYTTADPVDLAVPGPHGAFRGQLTYLSDTSGAGQIEVYAVDQKNGTEVDMVTIPVQYTPTPDFIKG